MQDASGIICMEETFVWLYTYSSHLKSAISNLEAEGQEERTSQRVSPQDLKMGRSRGIFTSNKSTYQPVLWLQQWTHWRYPCCQACSWCNARVYPPNTSCGLCIEPQTTHQACLGSKLGDNWLRIKLKQCRHIKKIRLSLRCNILSAWK